MIHVSKLHDLVEQLSQFSLSWIAEDGRVIKVKDCKFTSFHGAGETFNIMLLPSGEVRTVNRYTVVEFNGEEVVL